MRGFFCSDLSLRYPYRECTITVPMLLVCMLLLPMLFIAVVEIVRICKRFRMRQYLRNVSRNLATFSFGFIATYLTTELAKNVVGRLRPHFYAACQPRLPSGSSCEDSIVTGTNELNGVTAASGYYVEHYYCANSQLSAEQQRELYVSFPSAHSSLSFYSMLFLAFYLHHVWHAGRGSCRVLRHILQFLLMLMAWFIALSRVADYWHHWSDVFAGALMGVAYATLTAIYVGGMLRPAQPLEDYVLTASALDTTHKHKVGNGGSNKLMQPMLVVAPQAGVACPCAAATPYNGGDSCATAAAHRKVSI